MYLTVQRVSSFPLFNLIINTAMYHAQTLVGVKQILKRNKTPCFFPDFSRLHKMFLDFPDSP